MTATPSDPRSAGDARRPDEAEPTLIALTLEDKLQLLWKRHSTLIVVFCVAVAAAIIGVGVWERHEASDEKEIESAYAAATTPESLKAFADAHPDHPLGGAAYLRMADDAFTAGKFPEALSLYEKGATVFKDGPLAARTKLGLAITKVVGGKAAEGTAELKQLAEDTNQFKGIRAEAAYHLASLAAEANNVADVQKYADLVAQVEPMSPWTQRAMALRASFPSTAVPDAKSDAPGGPPAPAAPAIQFTPSKK